MLYARWREIAADCADDLALADARTGQRLTFRQLEAASRGATTREFPFVWSMERGVDFILSIVRAWREGEPVCAVEQSHASGLARLPDWSRSMMPKGCVHLKLTSASTGAARAVAFTAEQLAADADNIVATMGLRREWPNLGVISLAHSYGFSNLVLPLLLHGIPLHLAAALPESMKQAASQLEHVTLPAVPALWRTWHEARAIPRNVQLAISAGAPLPVDLEQCIFKATGTKVHNFYGATECGGIAYDASDAPRIENACVGQAMRNVDLSRAESGCLVVRSKAAGLTYWPEPDRSLGSGCFHTSDVVEFRDGQVLLCGRLNDQINVAGRKVSPETVEAALRTDERVRDCIVFGIPEGESGRGEVIVACVAANVANADALRLRMAEKLPAWQIPREWLLLEDLPVNERGKLSRADWRQRYLEKCADSRRRLQS